MLEMQEILEKNELQSQSSFFSIRQIAWKAAIYGESMALLHFAYL
jgi:hypothetical protein